MRNVVVLILALLAGCSTGPQVQREAGDRYAIIYTAGSRKAEGIFPVTIYSIDGRETSVDKQSWRLEPGKHVIKARGVVDRNWVGGISKDLSRENNAPLEHHFQSGTRYFLGLKASGSRRAEWELVIWKEELIEEGAHQFD